MLHTILVNDDIIRMLHNNYSTILTWSRFVSKNELIELVNMKSEEIFNLLDKYNLVRRKKYNIPRSAAILAIIAARYNTPNSYEWLVDEFRNYDDVSLSNILLFLNMDIYKNGFLTWSAVERDNIVLPPLTKYFTIINDDIIKHNSSGELFNYKLPSIDINHDETDQINEDIEDKFKDNTIAASRIELLNVITYSDNYDRIVKYYGIFNHNGRRVLIKSIIEDYWKIPSYGDRSNPDLSTLADILEKISLIMVNFETIYVNNELFLLDDPYLTEIQTTKNPDIVAGVSAMNWGNNEELLDFMARI